MGFTARTSAVFRTRAKSSSCYNDLLSVVRIASYQPRFGGFNAAATSGHVRRPYTRPAACGLVLKLTSAEVRRSSFLVSGQCKTIVWLTIGCYLDGEAHESRSATTADSIRFDLQRVSDGVRHPLPNDAFYSFPFDKRLIDCFAAVRRP